MTVFANGKEVSCKAQQCKVIAAFPDVCMTPPQTPATPPGVPIPYPNFGMDADTTKGTSTVKIGGKTINQKNKSYFSKTSGDEAGCAPKKGVVSSKNMGKSYSQAWSMDVKADGQPVCRFTDISTGNHGSPPNTPPMPKVGAQDFNKAGMSDDERKAKCLKLRAQLMHKNNELRKEFRKYDPVKDAKGGFKMRGGKLTKPCGHYTEMRNLQKGMRNDLILFNKECAESGVKIARTVRESSVREVEVPPGCTRIPINV
ncbi:hypothetical protein Ga0609869_002457 [Rhodovulum iodosum]|uniref:DUF4150 domain-containing protein n=1 Tax=Rhodovulum iodosum TaxID=68291 RepID=A0ABV3XUU0_9RHOB|nr:DUF4150 domain-containing protein [Rhodovulum robiginosum]RSK35143.1 DUF4150 domain-containing protein [Rhodovulum robiginosum]